jgi:hypothetical protein
VLEIGCGRGDFLEAVCRRSGAAGVGIDPSATAGRFDRGAGGGLELVREEYGPQHAGFDAGLVACRHTLEHVADVRAFLELVRDNQGADGSAVLFLEVPETERILAEGAFWDVYYEHASYFTAGSMSALLRRTGFAPFEVRRTYGEQYLQAFARPGTVAGGAGGGALAPAVEAFRTRCAESLGAWYATLGEAARRGEDVVLWGSGSKATAFLECVAEADAVRAVVDVNPAKHGRFVAGSGLEIVEPEALRTLEPALVIVMNPVYVDEIGAAIEGMGLTPRVLAL